MTRPRSRPVLLTVSGTISDDLAQAVAAGRRPRVDYLEMAEAFDADLVDYAAAAGRNGRFGHIVERLLGRNAALAWCCFVRCKDYEVIVTDGEQIGLPLAALLRLRRRRGAARHIMIVHIMSVPKKVWLYRVLGLGRRIDEMVVYATAQQRFVVDRLRFPRERVTLSPFMVDTNFFAPCTVRPTGRSGSPLICSAGLEFRDYPTMLAAVKELDVEVVLAAASPWSKRGNPLEGVALPPNVEVVRLDLHALRQLYADASIVVMPLREVDFQAGVTTLLEAMSMSKPIICSRTSGQTDVITDDVTGRYVPVGDPVALRDAITCLLADDSSAERLGTRAREWAVRSADIDVYVRRLADRVDHHRRAALRSP